MRNDSNLYWDSNNSDNMETSGQRDPLYANPSDIRSGLVYRDPATNEIKFGTMPANQDLRIRIGPGERYTIPQGYHSGNSIIIAQELEDATFGTATEQDIAKNKVAWVNGERLVGELDLNENGTIGSATSNDILLGKTAWANRQLLTGTIQSIFPRNVELLAGEEYVFEKGYYEGGTIGTRTLADQTIGTAVTDDIKRGKLAWVDGVQLEGTAKTLSEELADATVQSPDIRKNKIGYGTLGKVTGSMEEYLRQPLKELLAGTSFTIPEGYTDGRWTIQAASLMSQTIGTSVAADILKDKTAWVNGQLLTGTLIQNFAPNTNATATPNDIRQNKTAWVNGEQITGTSPYNTINFKYSNSNDEDPLIPLVILLPTHNWEYLRYLKVEIISTVSNNILYEYDYDDIYTGSVESEDENGNPALSIITILGSPKITITSFVANAYIKVFAYGYTMS